MLESQNDIVLQRDIEEIANNMSYQFEKLDNKTIFPKEYEYNTKKNTLI